MKAVKSAKSVVVKMDSGITLTTALASTIIQRAYQECRLREASA
jgi:hypothetical protein